MRTTLTYETNRQSAIENRQFGWLGWAVYLGMSWTWCIGMFLPVLLARDFGVWSWFVFAIPNVLGAAAMGWVLRREQSHELVEQHHAAVAAFSIVTVAFQLFFLWWLLSWCAPGQAIALGVTAGVLTVVFLWATRWRVMAMGVWLASMVLVMLAQRPLNDNSKDVAKYFGRIVLGTVEAPPVDVRLIPLAAACLFGFALCPYLDGTFHAARQGLGDRQSRRAFSVGFGVFFLSMILFSFHYAIERVWRWNDTAALMSIAAISTHVTIQLAFTIGVHIGRSIRTAAIALLIAAAAVIASRIVDGEIIYRLFMSFYGLVFPAYVWLCMLPTWNNPQTPTQRQLSIFAIVIIVAAPMFWLAFIENKMMWVLPGLAVILLARLFVCARPARPVDA